MLWGWEGDPEFAGFSGGLGQASRHQKVSQGCPSFCPGSVSIVRCAWVCSATKCPSCSACTAGVWLVRDRKAVNYGKAGFFSCFDLLRLFFFFSPSA